ncbi:MAG: hypothetical protein ABW185_07895 [Sedimenticola sp.]
MKKYRCTDTAGETGRVGTVKAKRKLLNVQSNKDDTQVVDLDSTSQQTIVHEHIPDKTNSKQCSKTKQGKEQKKAKKKAKQRKDESETVSIVADVHRDNSDVDDVGSFLNVMFRESNENIEGRDLVNVMNRFADEMTKMNSNMQKMWQDVNTRIDTMAVDIEKKVTNKLNNVIDKRVNNEAVKMKREIGKSVDQLRGDISDDLKCLQEQIDEIPRQTIVNRECDDKSLNFCIRNHDQRENENVSAIVTDLLKEGLNLRGMKFKKAVRKGRVDNKPGIIIVTCETVDDKNSIMQKKTQLRNSRRYERVYLHVDQSIETRVNSNNMKILLSALRIPGVRLRGSRLIVDSQTDNNVDLEDGNVRHNNNRESHNSYGTNRPQSSRNNYDNRDDNSRQNRHIGSSSREYQQSRTDSNRRQRSSMNYENRATNTAHGHRQNEHQLYDRVNRDAGDRSDNPRYEHNRTDRNNLSYNNRYSR